MPAKTKQTTPRPIPSAEKPGRIMFKEPGKVRGTSTVIDPTSSFSLESIDHLRKDLKKSETLLQPQDIRYLVDAYYSIQEYRIAADGQVRAASVPPQTLIDEITNAAAAERGEPLPEEELDMLLREQWSPEPHEVLTWLASQADLLEGQIKRALDWYTDVEPSGVGRWSKSIVGIGPVIAAGLMANLDITKAPTVGHFYSFAGLDPKSQWLGREKAKVLVAEVVKEIGFTPSDFDDPERTSDLIALLAARSHRNAASLFRLATQTKDGQPILHPTIQTLQAVLAKRPWNARLKVLCWRLGESFVKVCNRPDAHYGRLYLTRKAFEVERNERGDNAEWAKGVLLSKNISTATDAYQALIQGKLPQAQLHARAKRWAVKIFLSHLHHVMYRAQFHTDPPQPYALAILNHAHYIPVPNQELVPA